MLTYSEAFPGARQARHPSLSTKARYTHMVQGDLERAVELFGNLLVTVPGRAGPMTRSAAVFPPDQGASADGV